MSVDTKAARDRFSEACMRIAGKPGSEEHWKDAYNEVESLAEEVDRLQEEVDTLHRDRSLLAECLARHAKERMGEWRNDRVALDALYCEIEDKWKPLLAATKARRHHHDCARSLCRAIAAYEEE